MRGRVGVIGSNMVDLVTYVTRMPARGETLEAPTFAIGCGGKGANQAIAAARLGSEVVMVTNVGDDIFAEGTIRNFKRTASPRSSPQGDGEVERRRADLRRADRREQHPDRQGGERRRCRRPTSTGRPTTSRPAR